MDMESPETQREFELMALVGRLQDRCLQAELERNYLRTERRRLLDDIGEINSTINKIRCDYESDAIPF